MCNRLFNLLLCAAFPFVLSGQSPINPLVHNGIVVALSDNVDNYIFADFLVLDPSPDSCVRYSFTSSLAGLVRNFKCSDLGVTQLKLWTTSPGSLYPTATSTYALVQDNFGDCPGYVGGLRPIVCCRNGLALALNGSGTVTVTPQLWDLSTAICNNDPDVHLSFSADPADTTKVLDCSMLGINIVQIWATGSNGYQNYAEVYFNLQDNIDVCFSGGAPGLPLPRASMGVSATFDYGGQIRLTASDFDAGSQVGSSAACLPLHFSFSADTADVTRVFDCTTLGTKPLDLWVTDACGKQNFVNTYLLITNNGACANAQLTPPNDNRADAVALNFDHTCAYYWSNENATVESGEPEPAMGSCQTPGTWCDTAGAEHTVWFSFEMPASGSAVLTTAGMQTQMAVYEQIGGDLVLVDANDDLPGNPEGAAGLTLACQDPGKTFWVQIDGYNGAMGSFLLGLEDPGITCLVSGQNNTALACGENPVTPVQSTGAGVWQYLLDGSNAPVAAINDMGNALGQVTAEYMINGDAIRTDAAGNPYLDRNWTISVAQQPQSPVLVKFFVKEQEWAHLSGATGGPATPDMLKATKVSGSTCGDYAEGGVLLSNKGTYTLNGAGDLAALYAVDGFSSFYLHGGNQLTATAAPAKEVLAVYPNPARREIRIDGWPAPLDAFRVTFSNLAGIRVLETGLTTSGQAIRLPALPAGLYLLKATDGHRVLTGKVFISE